MAQSVEHPTSAQVMISQFMSSSLTLGFALTVQNAVESVRGQFLRPDGQLISWLSHLTEA